MQGIGGRKYAELKLSQSLYIGTNFLKRAKKYKVSVAALERCLGPGEQRVSEVPGSLLQYIQRLREGVGFSLEDLKAVNSGTQAGIAKGSRDAG